MKKKLMLIALLLVAIGVCVGFAMHTEQTYAMGESQSGHGDGVVVQCGMAVGGLAIREL